MIDILDHIFRRIGIMGKTMSNKKDIDKLKALASELAKDVKTPKDLNTLNAFLIKLTFEGVLISPWLGQT
jgi:hypothetical protein